MYEIHSLHQFVIQVSQPLNTPSKKCCCNRKKHRHPTATMRYLLVNVYITNWKITMLSMGKSTISTGSFSMGKSTISTGSFSMGKSTISTGSFSRIAFCMFTRSGIRHRDPQGVSTCLNPSVASQGRRLFSGGKFPLHGRDVGVLGLQGLTSIESLQDLSELGST